MKKESKLLLWFRALKNVKFGKPMEGHNNLVFTWPNFLTALRFVSTALAIYFASKNKWLISLIVIIIGSITDFFDGWLARRQGSSSVLGAIMDPTADKALLLVLFVINPYVCVAIAMLELGGSYFSNSVRNKDDRGGHFIAFGSKDITMYQLFSVGLLYLNKTGLFNFPANLEIILLSALVAFSLIRFSIYRSVYWSDRKQGLKKDSRE